MSWNFESFHIVQHLLNEVIIKRLNVQIINKIILQNLQKINSLDEIKQTTKKLLPKIVETINLKLQNCPKVHFSEENFPQNPTLKFKRKLETSNDHKNYQEIVVTSKSWLKSYRKTKNEPYGSQRNSAIYSCQCENKSEKYEDNSNQLIQRSKHIKTQKFSSSFHLDGNKKSKEAIKQSSKLVKLNLQNEKQDDFIKRKRQNFLRKKFIQKKLETINQVDKAQGIQTLTEISKKITSPTFHSFTTDYNGQLIKLKNCISDDQVQRKKSSNLLDKLKRKHMTASSSPQKDGLAIEASKKNVKISREHIESQAQLKEKPHIKVKIKTFVQHLPLKSTKIANTEVIYNKKLKEIQRNSSDDFEYQSADKLKSLKFFQSPLDYHSIMKNMQLSPGVILTNPLQFNDDKENDTYLQITTTKSIGKPLARSNKTIFYDHSSTTIKNIMPSQNLIKNESKLKKTHQKHPKFTQIHNQFH